jgi:hypothetical protein
LLQLTNDCRKGFDVTAKIAGIAGDSKSPGSLTLEVNEKPVLILAKDANGHPKYTPIIQKSNL